MTEADIQAAIIDYLAYACPGAVIHHSRNEGNRGGSKGLLDGARGKRMGVRAGFPDIAVLWRGLAFWIEVKTAKGAVSKTQKQCRDDMAANGFPNWFLCRSVDDAAKVVEFCKSQIRGIKQS